MHTFLGACALLLAPCVATGAKVRFHQDEGNSKCQSLGPTGTSSPAEGFIDCQAEKDVRVMLLSNGLANDGLQKAFGNLVQDYMKKTGKKKLNALIFWDSCFLKESVWNTGWENGDEGELKSGDQGAANAEQLGATNREAIEFNYEQYFGGVGNADKLEGYGCEDFADSFRANHDLNDTLQNVSHVSLLDLIEPSGIDQVLAALAAPQVHLEPKLPEEDGLPRTSADTVLSQDTINMVLKKAKRKSEGFFEDLKRRIEQSDIIAFDGGNPDVHALGFGLFGDRLTSLLRATAQKGKIFVGRSAGAMILSSAIMTYEPQSAIYNHLLFPHVWPSMEGLGLVGKCAIRPHWLPKWLNGASYFAQKTGLVVMNVRNGEGATCIGGECKLLLHEPITDDVGRASEYEACKHVKPSPCSGEDVRRECVMQWRLCFKACVDAAVRAQKMAAESTLGKEKIASQSKHHRSKSPRKN
eukprot:TRINITY_DN20242_c0_g1_i1.p1 TRINITY_DN20242_c0_g1~~TRINITY_DN20242_c0_g1_i1.p1  ORF type:complete len:469 (+),score=50.75 TRINITY_DN20242_c0_g1_i1:58-1464(+)